MWVVGFRSKLRKGKARELNEVIYMDTEITQDDGNKTKALRKEQSFHKKKESIQELSR